MLVENHDNRIRFYELMLEKNADEPLESFSLPDNYHFEFYQPGDEMAWIEIELSAGELINYEQGVKVFNQYFGEHRDELSSRMVFICTSNGEKVATASAWWNIHQPGPKSEGWLHWVAVKKKWQNCGLSKPLVTYVLQLLQNLGAKRFVVPTQTTTWVACKLYMDLGFKPIPENLRHNLQGWAIIQRLCDHPSLDGVPCATMHEIFPNLYPDNNIEERQEHSCGAVVFGISEEHTILFLLVQSARGEWGFPKGHVEGNEKDQETAIREIKEETGINVCIMRGFRRESMYMLGNKGKRVTYFLAKASIHETIAVHDVHEIRKAVWCRQEEALSLLRMDDRIAVFKEAIAFLQVHKDLQ